MTGECDEDVMVLGEGAANFTLCGQNHGQHSKYLTSNHLLFIKKILLCDCNQADSPDGKIYLLPMAVATHLSW